jgi:ATP-dependent Clp protease ATP-binding subunit ClpB
MPTEIDELERRRIMQLEIEREALKKESDKAEQGAARGSRGARGAEGAEPRAEAQWRTRRSHRRGQGLKKRARRAEDRARAGAARGDLERRRDPVRRRCRHRGEEALDEPSAKLAELQEAKGADLCARRSPRGHRRGRLAWTGIPVSQAARRREGEAAQDGAAHLRERVVGQDEACAAVSTPCAAARAGLSDPNRPIGSFLFLGPTGVGKTELARRWRSSCSTTRGMVRIDMSEYMEKHA